METSSARIRAPPMRGGRADTLHGKGSARPGCRRKRRRHVASIGCDHARQIVGDRGPRELVAGEAQISITASPGPWSGVTGSFASLGIGI